MPAGGHSSSAFTTGGHRHDAENNRFQENRAADIVSFGGSLYEACSLSEEARQSRETRSGARRRWALASFALALTALTCVVLIASPHRDNVLAAAKLRIEQLKLVKFFNLSDDPQLTPKNTVWGYGGDVGPAKWGTLSPQWGTCSTGNMQSPINIDRSNVVEFDLPRLQWKGFEKGTETGSQYAKEFYDGKSIALGDLDGPIIEVMGFSRYLKDLPLSHVQKHNFTLSELRFHTPSEHTIDGQRFAAEMQLMHECNAKTSPACHQTKLMVVSVMFAEAKVALGEKSPGFIETLIDDIKLLGGVWSQYVSLYSFDFGSVLGTLQSHVSRYFFLKGSLTSPPCTEDVTWFVLKDSVPISSDDLAFITSVQGANTRPLQAANERVIFSI